MAEQLGRRGPETRLPGAEALEHHTHHEKHAARASQEAPREARESEASIRASIDKLAVSGREIASQHEKHQPSHHRPVAITREIKTLALQRTLKRAQRRLPRIERSLSQFMHQPVVNRASEIGGKTLARPSGILGGGTVAFIGSAILYATSRRYGFAYNFSSLLFLFAGGFVFGMILELGIYSLRIKKR